MHIFFYKDLFQTRKRSIHFYFFPFFKISFPQPEDPYLYFFKLYLMLTSYTLNLSSFRLRNSSFEIPSISKLIYSLEKFRNLSKLSSEGQTTRYPFGFATGQSNLASSQKYSLVMSLDPNISSKKSCVYILLYSRCLFRTVVDGLVAFLISQRYLIYF